MMGIMKSGPFQDLLDAAKFYDIDVSELTPGDIPRIESVKAQIEARKQADDSDPIQYVAIRVEEWHEWIPGRFQHTGTEMQNPRAAQDRAAPPTIPHRMALHSGYTVLKTQPDEKLLEVVLSGTGKTRIIEPVREEGDDDNEGDEKLGVMYGLYLFQAILAKNVSATFAAGVMDGQNQAITEEEERARTEGRDRRKDLMIVEGGVVKPPPSPPNRKQRRSKSRGK